MKVRVKFLLNGKKICIVKSRSDEETKKAIAKVVRHHVPRYLKKRIKPPCLKISNKTNRIVEVIIETKKDEEPVFCPISSP